MSQFVDNAEEYRCCCELCHVKTATTLVGVAELCLLLYFFVNSIVLISTISPDGGGLHGGLGSPSEPLVQGPFVAAIIGLCLGFLCVILLFIAVSKKIPALLLPHFVLQIIALFLLLGLIIVGIVGLSTDLVVFYRLLNAVAFTAPPMEDTVGLIICYSLYCLLFLIELVGAPIVWRCYSYLLRRREYVKYIEQYSMPLSGGPGHTQTMPMPTYYHGNTLYLHAKRASD